MSKSKKTAISPVQDSNTRREIPGNDGGSLSKYIQLISILRTGQGFFTKKIGRHKSTVFRMSLGVKGIAVCDRKGIDVLFDLDKIYKEAKFGRLDYNICLLGNQTPSIFKNGQQHELQKEFLIKICEIAQNADILKTVNEIVPQYLSKWNKADSKVKADWETDVMSLVSDIFSEAFLGVKVDPSCMHDMVYASWTRKSGELARGTAASQKIVNKFKESKKIDDILKISREMGISDEQSLADTLFMLNFNGYGALSGSIRSALARLHNADDEMKKQLKEEIGDSIGEDGVTHEALKKMKLLERFVLEVFRMEPPVPLIFGRANEDFVLESRSGCFEVKANELLIGNIYLVQRDPEVFKNPDTFLPSRFEDESLLDHIIFTNGPYQQRATKQDHQCPGKDIIFTIMKATLVPVILCCEYTFTQTPYWSGKRLRRIGCPDNKMELKEFSYKPKEGWIHGQQLQVEEVN